MSKAAHNRVRFMMMLCIVTMLIPWNLSNASADDATPSDPPTQVDPTATTEVPVATDVPVEPTATAHSTEIPTETSVPTATETPESDFSASAFFSYVGVDFRLCANDSRIGEADLQYFGGAFGGAETIEQCRSPQGVTITLTDLAGVYGPYVFDIPAGQSGTQLYNQVQEATYIVSYAPTGASTFPAGSFADSVVLSYDGELEGHFQIQIQLYVASEADPDPIPTGIGNIGVHLSSCQDADRAGETDFLINVVIGSSVNECEISPIPGQVAFTLAGTTSDGSPYGPLTSGNDCCTSYQFGEVPYGTYTITESIYGNESEPFVVGGVNGRTPRIEVRNYFDIEPVYQASLQVAPRSCEDPTREGELDYLLVHSTGFGATSTCFDNSAFAAGLVVTIFDSSGNPVATTTDFTGGYNLISALDPGTYTAQLEGYSASQSFELLPNVENFLDIVVYSAFNIEPEPPGTGENARLSGAVAFCTSDEYAGQVQYIIDVDFFASGTGECVAGPENTGVLFVYQYANSGDSAPAQTWTLPVIRSAFDSDSIGSFPAGYYRVGFSPTSFADPISLSDEFPMRTDATAGVNVYYYGEQVETSILQIRKDICYSDERADTTDFFFQQEELGIFFGTDDTMQCRVANPADGEYTYTLTDVESGESVNSAVFNSLVILGYLSGVPAGTYTLTEQNGEFTRTSEPFEFDPSGGDYSVLVRNYVAGEMPPFVGEPQQGGILLWSYDCIDAAKAGTSEFFFNPGIIGTDPGEPEIPGPGGEFGAASVSNCVATGLYSFELDDGETSVYPMVQNPLGQEYVYSSSLDGITPASVPPGTYVIRETTTGAVSEPIDVNIAINIAAFYHYADAPTPTPSPTFTPEPTATYTPEPTATYTPEPTATYTPEPAATYTPEPTATFTPEPTATFTPEPTATFTPEPTATATTEPTATATETETPVTPDELVATDVTLTVTAGQTITGDLNDYVTGGVPPYTFAAGIPPTQGTLIVNPDGTFTFTANIDASGTDSFTFDVSDSQAEAEIAASATDSGLVSLVFAPPGETPVASPTVIEPTATTETAATATATTGDVSTLPSTGQGSSTSMTGLLQVMLLAVLALILLAAGVRQRGRRA